jgi:hypothetical protein
MKWISLSSGKKPEYGQNVFLCNENDGEFNMGKLQSITETSQGRLHFFDVGECGPNNEVINTSRFTHYAIPERPKK